MKISFMTFSCPEWDLDTILKRGKEYGFEGIEPRAEIGHKHGIELGLGKAEIAEIKQKVRDSGLALPCLAVGTNYSASDDDVYRQAIENCKQHAILAGELGIGLMRVFGGLLPEPKEENREKYYDRIAKGLAETGRFAHEHGVTLCLETHDDFCRVKNVAEVLRRADAPGLSVNWDFTHSIVCGDEPKEVYPLIKGQISHLHSRDCKYKGQGSPWPVKKLEYIRGDIYQDWEYETVGLGEGDMPVREVMSIMLAENFSGFFSLEKTDWKPEFSLPRDAANFHALLKEIRGNS
ncbi:MAG: sugar phosphate isomerase/epimerase [Candidatus Omnitrophica bacterium]|nr:sugar phosphate isomerase/epimerase [Candidatus Omnitrophota bacterium]